MERLVLKSSCGKMFVGMLWILFISAVSSCPDTAGTMDCNIIPVAGLNCTYVKGMPQNSSVDILDGPSRVKTLDVITGFASVDDQCESRLNITWTVSQDGSVRSYTGFFLTISFVYLDLPRFINRTFSVDADWNTAYKTLFVHDCVVPAAGTLYHIELYSLPWNDARNHAKIDMRTATNGAPDNQCPRMGGDANNSSRWVATMWTTETPSDASIEVCFYTAPPAFNFTQYAVSLLPNAYDPYNRYVQQIILTVDVVKDVLICRKFLNVCSGVYKIWVMPIDDPRGTCRYQGEDAGSCTATVVNSIDMTASVCVATDSATIPTTTTPTPSPTTPSPTTPSPATPSPTTPSPGSSTKTTPTSPTTADPYSHYSPQPVRMSDEKIAGIVVGVVLAVIVVAALIAVFCFYKRRINIKRRFPGAEAGEKPLGPRGPLPIDDQQTVLLVYSSDTECHRKVVRNLAAFLHSCCKCDVRFDDWSQVDISQTNALDWLTKQLHHVRHIVFINSLGAFMQHKAWVEGAACLPVHELLLPDMFIPALRQIQARVYEKGTTKQRLRYYHVYFPYTDAKHLLDVSFGQRYKLMRHVEDLFLNIHGMTKYSETGLTSACRINANGYTGYAEGLALKSAIDEACTYVKNNPNWFDECYTYIPPDNKKEVTLIKYRPVHGGDSNRNSDCHPLTTETSIDSDSPQRPTSYNSTYSNASTNKSSDEGVDFDPEIIPPSVSGSSSDLDRRSMLSGDVGFGDAGDNSSTFDPNSPTGLLGFCPPVLDEEDDGETTSIGSRMFFDRLNELNEQYDSGIPFSSFELKPSNRSSC